MKRNRHSHINCPHVDLSDPDEPSGYLQWHAWADEQTKFGRRQKHCKLCGRWYWPAAHADTMSETTNSSQISSQEKK